MWWWEMRDGGQGEVCSVRVRPVPHALGHKSGQTQTFSLLALKLILLSPALLTRLLHLPSSRKRWYCR